MKFSYRSELHGCWNAIEDIYLRLTHLNTPQLGNTPVSIKNIFKKILCVLAVF